MSTMKGESVARVYDVGYAKSSCNSLTYVVIVSLLIRAIVHLDDSTPSSKAELNAFKSR